MWNGKHDKVMVASGEPVELDKLLTDIERLEEAAKAVGQSAEDAKRNTLELLEKILDKE